MADGACDTNSMVNRSLKPDSIARIVELARKHCTAEQWGEWLGIPLEFAAAGGDNELTVELMQAGAYGDPISEAMRAGQHDIVKHLGQKPDDGHIRLAVTLGSEAMMSLLLELGADADPEDLHRGNDTPLCIAAKEGQAGMVGLLLDAGADAGRRTENNVQPVEKESALDIAAAMGHVNVIKEITKRQPSIVNSVAESTGYTALHIAAERDQLGSIHALVEAGADVNAMDGVRNGTALHAAIATRRCETILLYLLRHGAHVDSTREDGMTPLCIAVKKRNRVAADTLLSAGAEANTPLLLASAQYMSFLPVAADDIVLTFLRRGADVNTRRLCDGNTPLHLAAMGNSVSLVDALLKAGGDETAANDNGETPVDMIQIEWTRRMIPPIPGGDVTRPNIFYHSLRSLLVNAPRDRADRAWARRGFFVLCRAFPSKVRLLGLALPADRGIEGCSSTASTSDGPTTSRNSSRRPTARVEAGDEEQCFRAAMASLLGLESDIIFRTVVEFL